MTSSVVLIMVPIFLPFMNPHRSFAISFVGTVLSLLARDLPSIL